MGKPEVQGELPLEMLSGASHAKRLDELTMYRWREERGQRTEARMLCRVKSVNWPGQRIRLRSRKQRDRHETRRECGAGGQLKKVFQGGRGISWV